MRVISARTLLIFIEICSNTVNEIIDLSILDLRSSLLQLKILFPITTAKKERLAKRKEKKEGVAEWSQGSSDWICPISE